MRSLSAFLSQSLVTVCLFFRYHLVRLIPRTRVAQAQYEVWNIVSCPKVFTSQRAMSYVTSLMSGTPFTWHMHSFPHVDTAYLYFYHFPLILLPARCNPAPIYVNLSVVHLRNPKHPQKKQTSFHTVKKLFTARVNPARTQTKHHHQVIKERRPILTKQQSERKASHLQKEDHQ